jgi:hypothetical protein
MTLLLETRAKVIAIDTEDWPRCDKCHMPVENFEVTDTGDSLALMAACHGEVELVQIPDSVWDTVFSQGVSIGPAFKEKPDGQTY